MTDNVNHPPHYKQGGIECIEAIRAALTPEEFRGYCKGNVLKYVWRERHKGQDESIAKALWYGAAAIEPIVQETPIGAWGQDIFEKALVKGDQH